jgi:hypothetical protein
MVAPLEKRIKDVEGNWSRSIYTFRCGAIQSYHGRLGSGHEIHDRDFAA